MVKRTFWVKKIADAWAEKSLIWLSGVRRTGKTFLCQSLPDIEYFDCELPRVRRLMDDPESFLNNFHGKRIVLDEIHRLMNPSEILKIAADHYPDVNVIATGSSMLGASTKFRDTLTGRKAEIWLTPMNLEDLSDFGNIDLSHRFLHGGLPPNFLSEKMPERDMQEWIDAYWAKDIQELFRLERRHSFMKFTEMLFAQSGGIFEATRFTRPCEVSRTTIANYLSILEATFVVHVIRPFSSHRPTEIVSAPKVYAFDTGFVCTYRGWTELRQEDRGILWEHFVLNEIQAHLQMRKILYWRDKRGHEIDFVLLHPNRPPLAIECKWRQPDFGAGNLISFRKQYPEGENFVVTSDSDYPITRQYGGITVQFVSIKHLVEKVICFISAKNEDQDRQLKGSE